MANDRKLFIKVYKILINTVLVYNVKILTMQVAIIKTGKIFWGKVAISVKTQVSYCFMFKANKYGSGAKEHTLFEISYCFMFKANKYAVLSSAGTVKMINQYCANYQYIYM